MLDWGSTSSTCYVGDENDALGDVLEVDLVHQIFAVENRQVRVGYDGLAHNFSLELLNSVELCWVLIHGSPVGVDQIVDDFLSEGLGDLSVAFQPF